MENLEKSVVILSQKRVGLLLPNYIRIPKTVNSIPLIGNCSLLTLGLFGTSSDKWRYEAK